MAAGLTGRRGVIVRAAKNQARAISCDTGAAATLRRCTMARAVRDLINNEGSAKSKTASRRTTRRVRTLVRVCCICGILQSFAAQCRLGWLKISCQNTSQEHSLCYTISYSRQRFLSSGNKPVIPCVGLFSFFCLLPVNEQPNKSSDSSGSSMSQEEAPAFHIPANQCSQSKTAGHSQQPEAILSAFPYLEFAQCTQQVFP